MTDHPTREAVEAACMTAGAYCDHVERFAYDRHGAGLDASPHCLSAATRHLIAMLRALTPPATPEPAGDVVEALRGMMALYDADEGTRSLPEYQAAIIALRVHPHLSDPAKAGGGE